MLKLFFANILPLPVIWSLPLIVIGPFLTIPLIDIAACFENLSEIIDSMNLVLCVSRKKLHNSGVIKMGRIHPNIAYLRDTASFAFATFICSCFRRDTFLFIHIFVIYKLIILCLITNT